jgi:hypothetical protein
MTKKRGPGTLRGTIDEIKAGTAPIALTLLMLGAWLLK